MDNETRNSIWALVVLGVLVAGLFIGSLWGLNKGEDRKRAEIDELRDERVQAEWNLVACEAALNVRKNSCGDEFEACENFLDKFLTHQSICPPGLTESERNIQLYSKLEACKQASDDCSTYNANSTRRIIQWEQCSADEHCWSCIYQTAKARTFGDVEFCWENAR